MGFLFTAIHTLFQNSFAAKVLKSLVKSIIVNLMWADFQVKGLSMCHCCIWVGINNMVSSSIRAIPVGIMEDRKQPVLGTIV